ncbi:MAG: type III-A CRISPR-associated RAMP protein Csm3 [Anaerolineaceae bacterium 4572_78]|nr:MAG: type III-A CRISPR-associated RAMP protein Csm3 [Anaerolineaceae bacterium 4572_78]
MPIVRNGRNGRPYIPGSTLKGKMRSLSEKLIGAPQNRQIGRDITIHIAGGNKRDYSSNLEYQQVVEEQYAKYWVNPVFGVPSEVGLSISGPTRLIVRDVQLDTDSLKDTISLDLPYAEVKWENTVDRVTSAAVPRQIERVPEGAVFSPMEMVFSFYERDDAHRFPHVFTALQLVEDDYLGGHGSRGSGKVVFENLELTCKSGTCYRSGNVKKLATLTNLTDTEKNNLVTWVKRQISL